MIAIDDRTEWLEADGLGGFTSGTTSGIRTRRYHALLLTATTPPTGRCVLVNGLDAWIDTAAGTFPLSTQRYLPDVLHPDGFRHLVAFSNEPWPTWRFEFPDGTRVVHEVFVEHGSGLVVVRWSVTSADALVTLRVRPFLSGRDYHATHHENGTCRFDAERSGAAVLVRPYSDLPGIAMAADGEYQHAPDWYRNFYYSAERERGLDDSEDLASPGYFSWSLTGPSAVATLLLRTTAGAASLPADAAEVASEATRTANDERARRRAFPTPLERAADAYIVRRGNGRTVLAGYPWFTDWGRDTFIAIRGLCLATGRLAEARDILGEWAGAVSEGMLPNRFPDRGEAPEFNAVDASLWYVIAVHDLMQAADSTALNQTDRQLLEKAVEQIVSGYAAGTRFGIRMDDDGLLAAGVRGVQLTWMDARVGDRVITPRTGKPVEVQALWLNALWIAGRRNPRWAEALERGRRSFLARFWNEQAGFLADVVDVDHVRGTCDWTFRPNQILAVGGLPLVLVDPLRAGRIVAAVEERLLTPMGLRSLAQSEPGYAARYEGDSSARDAVYHQGTVWPWLLGAFVDAWVHRDDTPAARGEARRRFLDPVVAHLERAGLGHVSEIADAESPFTPRGCPFQAWSLGELLRIDRVILGGERRVPAAGERRRSGRRSKDESPLQLIHHS